MKRSKNVSNGYNVSYQFYGVICISQTFRLDDCLRQPVYSRVLFSSICGVVYMFIFCILLHYVFKAIAETPGVESVHYDLTMPCVYTVTKRSAFQENNRNVIF